MIDVQRAPEPMVYPIAEGIRRLGIKSTMGSLLVKSGQLSTFTIGRRRYVSASELERFIRAKLAEAVKESPDARRAKVSKAVKASVEARAKQRSASAA